MLSTLGVTPSRADFAAALVSVIEFDARLLRAVAVSEARRPGFVGRLLEDAEALAAVAVFDHNGPSRPTPAEIVMCEAIRNAGALCNLDALQSAPSAAAVDALVQMIVAQAALHRVTGNIERRQFTRTPPPLVRTAPR